MAAVGCSSVAEDGEDVSALGESGSDEATLRSQIRFDTFTDSIGSAASTETRKVFTSAAAYRNFFGHDAPYEVDFYRHWVAFYAAGTQSTGGYDASIVSIETSSSGATLYVKTRLESPGDNCLVTQALTKPYVLAKFNKPYPRARYVRFSKNDDTLWCDEPPPPPPPLTCAAVLCAPGTRCVDDDGPARCVPEPCPGAGRRNTSTLKCECNVLGICPLGSWWNDDPSTCGCE